MQGFEAATSADGFGVSERTDQRRFRDACPMSPKRGVEQIAFMRSEIKWACLAPWLYGEVYGFIVTTEYYNWAQYLNSGYD
jgi:hypothetical protein